MIPKADWPRTSRTSLITLLAAVAAIATIAWFIWPKLVDNANYQYTRYIIVSVIIFSAIVIHFGPTVYQRVRWYGNAYKSSALFPNSVGFSSVDYSHIAGDWYLYWLSYSNENPNTPMWMSGVQRLTVDGRRVSADGHVLADSHPISRLTYEMRGHLYGIRMVGIYYYSSGTEHIATELYNDVRNDTIVGIWCGQDNLHRFIVAPIILSKKPQTEASLNNLFKIHIPETTIIPKGQYRMYVSKSAPRQRRNFKQP